jgi:hypothetical protein
MVKLYVLKEPHRVKQACDTYTIVIVICVSEHSSKLETLLHAVGVIYACLHLLFYLKKILVLSTWEFYAHVGYKRLIGIVGILSSIGTGRSGINLEAQEVFFFFHRKPLDSFRFPPILVIKERTITAFRIRNK